MSTGFHNVVVRELRRLTSRPIYLVGMVIVPVVMALFFVGLLAPGLPLKVPAGVVDLDGSRMSRKLTRSLDAMELIDVSRTPNSYNEAMSLMQSGQIMGFFVIPENFEKDAVAGKGPALTYYYNLAIYVPGSLMFKGFKTMAVTTQGALVQTNLVDKGATGRMADVILQPLTISSHPLNNPWMNYSYYLAPSFIMGLIELMVFIMTAFSVTQEIKTGSSRQWLERAGGRIGTALVGKLLPQTIIFSIIGWGCNSLLYHWFHFPMNGDELWMFVGMFLLVVASQSFAVIVCSVLPNPRLALSICSLSGILAFSLAAFSFPVQAMYGGMAPFSWILPVRWYFMIYSDISLNGYAVYFARWYFIYLLIFPILAVLAAPLMKRALRRPVYVP